MQWYNIDRDLAYAQEIWGWAQYGAQTWLYIQGPQGTVRAWDIGLITEGYYEQYPDRLWDLYWNIQSVLAGHYHCCLTGKVWASL